MCEASECRAYEIDVDADSYVPEDSHVLVAHVLGALG
jgi:hypothetical protein